ncbi:MAG: type II CAAX endopeptidase family protein [Paracoccaceae bacterium]|nr:type II CAAX endopeptidase family protein [Paracoccaceae bacterium]
MHPPAFESFVAPARARPALWRLGLGIVLAAAIYLPGTFALLFGVWVVLQPGTDFLIWAGQVSAPTTPLATYLVLFASFPLMALGVFAAARLLHNRRPGTLFGRAPIVLRHFIIGMAVTFALTALTLLPVLFVGFDGIPNLDPGLWAALLPLTVLGVLVQTGAEELAFRGYLQQQLAARFRSPVAWLVLPSALFAVVHWNAEALGDNAWLPLAVAFLFGLFAADLTAKTGSIGAAWGIHFANNFNGIALVATQDTITGLSLYLTPYSASDPDLLGWSILPSLLLLAAAWYLTRRLTAR